MLKRLSLPTRLLRQLYVLLFCLLALTLPQVTAGQSRQVVSGTNIAADASFTIRTLVTIPDELIFSETDSDQLAGIWLGGLAPAPNTTPTVLALTWVPDTSSFWPIWRLQLSSELGLLPTPAKAESQVFGGMSIELDRPLPVYGHTYESVFSYDSHKNAVSVALLDATDGYTLYSGSFQTPPLPQQLYPAAGAAYTRDVPSAFIQFSQPVLTPGYAPTGMRINAGTPFESNTDLLTTQIEPSSNVVAVLIVPDPAPSGTFQVALRHGNTEQVVANFSAAAGKNLIALQSADLALGSSDVVAKYLENSAVRWEVSSKISVGAVTARFAPVTVDRSQGQITGALTLETKSALPGIAVTVDATLSELVWNEKSKAYNEKPYGMARVIENTFDLAAGANQLPIVLPMPTEPGMWKVAYKLTVAPDIKVVAQSKESLFVTYPQAATEPGKPYTIAVLPDTQYMTSKFPVIFQRQMQWLAENAAPMNIGMVLQVGDMTDHNEPAEWERVQAGFRLLSDITPFAVALGNHDMATVSAGAVAHRGESRIGAYFQASDFAALQGNYPGQRLDNTYHTVRLGDVDYLIVSLEFAPPNDALDWAEKVIASHPQHKVIVITHAYTAQNGYPITQGSSAAAYALGKDTTTTMNDGQGIWSKLLRKYPNVFMVLSGHIGVASIPFRTTTGDNGNNVVEMLVDYQWEPNGGDGWLVLVTFNPGGSREVKAYSPYQGAYRTDVDSYGYGNSFTIDATGKVTLTYQTTAPR